MEVAMNRISVVSNPWREAIEGSFKNGNLLLSGFPILGGRLLKRDR